MGSSQPQGVFEVVGWGQWEMSHWQLLLTALDGSAKSLGHLRGGAGPPPLPCFPSPGKGACLRQRGGLEIIVLLYSPLKWGENPLGWGSSQMETDVDQMLTTGWFKDTGGKCLYWLWGRCRELG